MHNVVKKYYYKSTENVLQTLIVELEYNKFIQYIDASVETSSLVENPHGLEPIEAIHYLISKKKIDKSGYIFL